MELVDTLHRSGATDKRFFVNVIDNKRVLLEDEQWTTQWLAITPCKPQ